MGITEQIPESLLTGMRTARLPECYLRMVGIADSDDGDVNCCLKLSASAVVQQHKYSAIYAPMRVWHKLLNVRRELSYNQS